MYIYIYTYILYIWCCLRFQSESWDLMSTVRVGAANDTEGHGKGAAVSTVSVTTWVCIPDEGEKRGRGREREREREREESIFLVVSKVFKGPVGVTWVGLAATLLLRLHLMRASRRPWPAFPEQRNVSRTPEVNYSTPVALLCSTT